MFSNRIANSARFLQMPAESQLLYFHMILRADDDGIVESYPLMKLLGMPPDNLKVLIAKRFVKQLNEDQVIVILDWTEHNKIRADRKVNSIYLPLLIEKCPQVPILKPKPRIDVKDNTRRIDSGQSTDGISKVKLSKVKLIKYNKKDIELAKILYELIKKENPAWYVKPNWDIWAEDIRKIREIDKRTYEQIKFIIEWSQKDDFWKNNILSPSKLRKQFNNLIVRCKAQHQCQKNSGDSKVIKI